MYLRGSDARKLFTAVGDLADIDDPRALAPAALGELARLVPGEVCAANTIHAEPLSINLLVTPDDVTPDPAALLRPYVHEDPLVTRLFAVLTGTPPEDLSSAREALRISDVSSVREWTATNLYQAAYRPFGFLHQMAGIADVSPAGRVRTYAVIRDDTDFTDRDRDVLTVILSELGRLHRRADSRGRLRTLAAAAYETARGDQRGVVAVDPVGRLLPLNAAAVELLADRELREHPRLRQLATGPAVRPLAATVHLQAATASVRVQVVPSSDPELRCLLVFQDDRRAQLIARQYRLTNRERDVLSLLAKGYTADAVARRLRLSPRTVHKHLERVYPKLRVRDRVTAVLRARELGMLDPQP